MSAERRLMPTETIKLDRQRDYGSSVSRAASLLREGGLVGFPTETVYGVGVRADMPEAVARLRRVKDRDGAKPFTVHVGDPAEVSRFVPQAGVLAMRFVRRAWPGPVTLVFPVADPTASEVGRLVGAEGISAVYYDGTVGMRCPSDEVAAAVLKEAGVPVVAASANRAGEPPARSASGVLAALDGEVDLLLDGGESRYAKPSTVVKVTDTGYEVLRSGVVDDRGLRRYGTLAILFVCTGNTCRSPMAAAICRRLLADRYGCTEGELADRMTYVWSAGVFGSEGAPASEGARAAMASRGIDLTRHTSTPLTVDLIERADYILCMTRGHLESVIAMTPSAGGKASLLAGETEIDDPFGSSSEVYEACAAKIEVALVEKLAEIEP